jgi:uncharacterized protein YndB with AHSA1/START domain
MTPEESGRDLTATRWIPFPPRKVWVACTTPSGLEAWWSPEDLRTTVRRLEVQPGGRVELRMRYAPALFFPEVSESFRAAGVPIELDLRGTFLEVVEEQVLVFDLSLGIGRAGAGVEMRTRLDLHAERDGTRVSIAGSGKDTPHWRTLGEKNLEAQLERLERHLGRKTEPRPKD